LCLRRKVHLHPLRYPERQRRDDDLVELGEIACVLSGCCGVRVADRALDREALGAPFLERGLQVRLRVVARRIRVRGLLEPAAIRRPSGTPMSFSSSSASSPITTTMRGATIASSCITRARHSGAARSVSATGHFTNTVP